MTREIKFRAYEKKTKTMRFIASIDFILEKIEIWVNLKSVLLGFSEVELMQYTGLKDRNGVEVYEGDIATCTSGCPHEVIFLAEYAGTYIGGMPAWYLSGLNSGYSWTGEEEITGNKFDNPELLEG